MLAWVRRLHASGIEWWQREGHCRSQWSAHTLSLRHQIRQLLTVALSPTRVPLQHSLLHWKKLQQPKRRKCRQPPAECPLVSPYLLMSSLVLPHRLIIFHSAG